MTVVTARGREELALSDEVMQLYSRCWKIADEALDRLKSDNVLRDAKIVSGIKETLQEIKDPYNAEKRIKQSSGPLGAASNLQHAKESIKPSNYFAQLSDIFSEKNNFPPRIEREEELRRLLKYITANFGIETKSLTIAESRDGKWHGNKGEIQYVKGMRTLTILSYVLHEIDHIREGPANIFFPPQSFKNEGRAMERYYDGKAVAAELRLLESNDDVVKLAYAVYFMGLIAMPTPEEYYRRGNTAEESRDTEASTARRYSEGFRDYYTWQARIGKELLDTVDRNCREKGFCLGIGKDGGIAILDDYWGIRELYTDKLKAGITDIDELIGKAPKFPEKMG